MPCVLKGFAKVQLLFHLPPKNVSLTSHDTVAGGIVWLAHRSVQIGQTNDPLDRLVANAGLAEISGNLTRPSRCKWSDCSIV